MNHTQKSYSNHIKKRCLCPLALTNQGDFIAGFSLVAIHYFHVSLGSGDALVRHDTLNGPDVRSGSSLQSGKCSPVRVERDVFGDTGSSNPLFHGVLRPASFQSLEYQSCLFRGIAD